jgi:hypothetical protein
VDTEQFIASLVSSLAWPAAVFGIAYLLRERLAQLLSAPIPRINTR